MDKMSTSVRVKLSLMMFLQFMMFAVWWQQLADYLTKMGVEGTFKSLILSSMALGCLASPIIGMIADRHFASQKVLAALNFICAALLFLAAKAGISPTALFVLLFLAMLCYMPTWGLTSAIAMANSPSEKFSQIRVFGSIGWVASGIFSIVAWKVFGSKIDGTNIPLLCGAATSLVAAIVNLTLPDTPPPAKGQKASVIDALGLRAVSLLKDCNFALFIIVSMLVMIPFSIYWSYCSMFLADKGFEFITATMNWGQFAEMFFMLLIPLALARMGIKKALLVGLIALLVRYLAFLGGGKLDQEWMYFVAILVHGLIFGFFFVGGQIYIDKKAPKEIRAQAQGFIFLVTFGVGLIIGNFFNGELIARNSTITEPVAQSYTLPDSIESDMLTFDNADVNNVRFYTRAISGDEVAMANAMITNDTLTINRLKRTAGDSIKLDDGLVHSDGLDGLAQVKPGNEMTFSALVYLPKEEDDQEKLTGTFFVMGTGDNAVKIGLDQDLLYLRAGEKGIKQRIPMPRGKDKEGKRNSVFIAGTYDGSDLRLYTQGAIYRRYDWDTIWTVTTIISAALLVIFLLFFKDTLNKTEQTVAERVEQESPIPEV